MFDAQIPRTLRLKLREVLWREYRAANTSSSGEFSGLERSAFLALVKDATGGQQKGLGALDNCAVKNGTENFKHAAVLIDELSALVSLSEPCRLRLHDELTKISSHMKYELGRHLRQHSSCASHCMTHLLSDPDNNALAEKCPASCGNHPLHCADCDSVEVFFATLSALVGQAAPSLTAEALAELRWRTKVCASRCRIFLRHEIRGHWEGRQRKIYVASLQDHQAIAVGDWKMKFLMSVFRESMVEFFGKAGECCT